MKTSLALSISFMIGVFLYISSPTLAQEIQIYTNNNPQSVQEVGAPSFTLTEPTTITRVSTYHWNKGKGVSKPGVIGITGVGSWPTTGSPGMNNVPNANWHAKPNVTLEPGTYHVWDSDPATWSKNQASGDQGIIFVYGVPSEKQQSTQALSQTGSSSSGDTNLKSSQSDDSSGIWSTSEGDMSLRQAGSTVKGKYSQDEGRISGTMSGNVLEGYWVEKSSAQKCDRQILGSYYWGRMKWTFDGDKFTGLWGYCDAALASNWNGKLKSGSPLSTSGTASTQPSTTQTAQTPPANQHADQPASTAQDTSGSSTSSTTSQASMSTGVASGEWTSSEGKLTMWQNGNQVTGNYDQDGGRISGTMTGNTLIGYWGEKSSGQRCNEERMGTYYWGRIQWDFSANAFNGSWAYCENDPSTKGWDGQKIKDLSGTSGNYIRTPDAAISGHNNRKLNGVSPEDCMRACDTESTFQCKSFDYYKNDQACDLSDKSAADVGGLKTNYDGNPYDHYARQ